MEQSKTTQVVGQVPVAAPRNFRHSADIENFYRFVHENELRHEAKKILEFILAKVSKNAKKKKKENKKKAH